jgi:hypothetical protein
MKYFRPARSKQVAAFLCLLPSMAWADLRILLPDDGVVRGSIVLSLDVSQEPVLARARYFLNGRPLGPVLTRPPFRYTWQTAGVWDGPAVLRVEGETADGTALSTVDVPVIIANKSGVLRTVSPDFAAPLSGVVQWRVEASRPIADDEVPDLISRGYSGTQGIEAFMFLVDGRLLRLRFSGNSSSVELDTTQFPNGPHELFVGAYSSARGAPPLAMHEARVIFDNGRSLQELRPRWREVFLAPGQSIPLEVQFLYTNGESEPVDLSTLEVSSTAPHTVAIRDGQIAGESEGVGEIIIKSGPRTASIRVHVLHDSGLPHFSRRGDLLTRYEPGSSLFVRSMFNLGTVELERTPGLAPKLRTAGINTLTDGLYSNPADGHEPDFETWKTNWELKWNRIEESARLNDLSLLLFGDDIARTPAELANSIQNPWAADAIRHAFTRARDSRAVVGVEMIDEVSFLWGGTPKPPDGRWDSKRPPVPADSFVKLMDILSGVANRSKVSWPIGATSSNNDAANWLGDAQFSDYSSLFWDKLDWRVAYPTGLSFPQVQAGQERATIGRLAVLQRSKPMLLQMSVTGPFYIKRGPGDEFVLGQDDFQSPGWIRPELCSAQAMLAVAVGAAGVRAYAYDSIAWKNSRSRARIGQGNLQTGSDPVTTGTDRWQAITAAFNLIGKLEPHLLQPRVNALHLGPNFVTAAREGPRSRVFLAVNFSEVQETASLDFTPYRFPDASTAKLFRLHGGSSSSQTVPNEERTTLQVRPGEAVVWLFQPPEESAAMAPSVAILSPEDGYIPRNAVTIEGSVEDVSRLKRIDLLVDGVLVESSDSLRPFTWDPTQERFDSWHSIALVAHFENGESSEARTAVWLGPPEPSPDSE